ncbi:MAG: preprotein translocase subunit TatC [Desulfobulbaceae bacterium A2]|nr:MAG: preprotein translocase subunit TatC [Desulfobulbaceae bacterium A2]
MDNQERRQTTVDPSRARIIVDVKGLSCPMPTLRTIKAIRQIGNGDILQVDSNDPGCRNMLPAWCKRQGHNYLGEKEQTGYNSYFIQK